MRVDNYQVVIVGGGSAAFEAAVAAKQSGARQVVMLEKAPEPEFGGNARFSHTGFRFAYSGAGEIREFMPQMPRGEFDRLHLPGYSPADFTADLMRVTRGRINKKLAEVLVHESNAAVHWMDQLGMQWEPAGHVEIGDKLYFEPGIVIHPTGGIGGGISQLNQWRDIATRMGVEIRYESRVRELLGNDRRVEGVRVSEPKEEYEIRAGATILCAGGFQANPEMRARYLGANADLMKVRGSRHDTGEVLQMALALGCKASGHWQGAHATPIDATFGDVELSNKANRYGYTFGITVNSLGQRFFDEGEAHISYTYAKTGWAVLSEPGGVVYQVFDRKGAALQDASYYQFAHPLEAMTIADLADKIGIEPAVLNHTVDTFNKAVRDDIPFDASTTDGRCTEGITPRKSNWAARIDEPPFQAFPVTGGITFTFGGIEINADAQAVDTGGRPIRGLFASGDIIGLFFHNYPSCTGQTRNVVFSRLAGRHAAAQGL